MKLDFGANPADWVVVGGRPARALGRSGMPAYEHEEGGLVVFELVIAQLDGTGGLMLFPRWYGMVCLLAPDGMVPLHHSPDAWWKWRPMIYRLTMDGWQTQGSQHELSWRFGLSEVQHSVHAGAELTFLDADDRAEALLRDCLSDSQLAEYVLTGDFRVRGAATGDLYRVKVGDGFEKVDPVTGQPLVGYCLHTEHWLPHADQALAVKFALESEELEADTLAGARAYPRPTPEPATRDEVTAAELEQRWGLVA